MLTLSGRIPNEPLHTNSKPHKFNQFLFGHAKWKCTQLSFRMFVAIVRRTQNHINNCRFHYAKYLTVEWHIRAHCLNLIAPFNKDSRRKNKVYDTFFPSLLSQYPLPSVCHLSRLEKFSENTIRYSL